MSKKHITDTIFTKSESDSATKSIVFKEKKMDGLFSDRISDVPKSFIREILKVAIDPSVISFAGGLPNRAFFPLEELKRATLKVFETSGRDALQYASTEGDLGLREYISSRYAGKYGLDVPVKNILITNGSQQGLDLLGKIFLNEGDDVIIEEPGYLGAIQAFSVYRASFNPVRLTDEGIDIEGLRKIFSEKRPKLMYCVPNFQNPSGMSYPESGRIEIARAFEDESTLLIEDDPYGDLRFSGEKKSSFWKLLPGKTVLLGSFSKTVAPALRLGWIAAPDHIMDRLIVAKQASDLHTNYLSQKILLQYLSDNDIDEHIKKITQAYGNQRLAMTDCIRAFFPKSVKSTNPEGGMFLWLTLPQGIKAMDLFDLAIRENVAFVPGDPFYTDGRRADTMRLNFSCSDEKTIETGMKRLANALKSMI